MANVLNKRLFVLSQWLGAPVAWLLITASSKKRDLPLQAKHFPTILFGQDKIQRHKRIKNLPQIIIIIVPTAIRGLDGSE